MRTIRWRMKKQRELADNYNSYDYNKLFQIKHPKRCKQQILVLYRKWQINILYSQIKIIYTTTDYPCNKQSWVRQQEAPSGHTHTCFWTGVVTLTFVLYAGISITVMWSEALRWGRGKALYAPLSIVYHECHTQIFLPVEPLIPWPVLLKIKFQKLNI